MSTTGTVYVVDDDVDMRASVHSSLVTAGFDVQCFASAVEFLERVDVKCSGCLVLDVCMPQLGGIELQRRLRKSGATIPIIMITAFSDVPTAVVAMKQGAIDYLEKPFREDVLVARIREALEIDARERVKRRELESVHARVKRLTPREREVMDLLVDGLISKQIAAQLGCSVRTIESHRARVMRKMKADTIAELVRAALQVRGHARREKARSA